jgi:hypothetical protein
VSDPIVELFEAVAGQHLPGGCDRCDAFQVVTMLGSGLASLVVHHDDDCPALRALAAGTN